MFSRIMSLTVLFAFLGVFPLLAQVDLCPAGTSTPFTDEPGFTPECVGPLPSSGECPLGFNRYQLNGFGYYCYAFLTHCPSGYLLGKTKEKPMDGCYQPDDLNAELVREAATGQLAYEVAKDDLSTRSAKQLKAVEDVFRQQEKSFCAHGTADCRRQFLENLKYRPIVLTPTGETGLVVDHVLGACGTGACSAIFVLRKVGQGYQKVLEGDGWHTELAQSTTKGFYDIFLSSPSVRTMYDALGVHPKQDTVKPTKYIWAGSGYTLTSLEQAEQDAARKRQREEIAKVQREQAEAKRAKEIERKAKEQAHTTRYRGLYVGLTDDPTIKRSGCKSYEPHFEDALESIGMGKSVTECLVNVDESGTLVQIIVFTRIPYMQEYRALVTQYGPSVPGRYAELSQDSPDCCNLWRIKDGTEIWERPSHLTMRGTQGNAYRQTVVPYTTVVFQRQ